MRTERVLSPQSISFNPLMMFLRACGLSSGATASSRSRKTTSAADCAALEKSFGLLPGTASSLRLRRAGACSMIVKLITPPLSCLRRANEVAQDYTISATRKTPKI